MTDRQKIGVRAFLKKLGFVFDRTPQQIDKALLSALSVEDRLRLQAIWGLRNAGFGDGLEMYEVPRTAKQATLLFSHDGPRAVATVTWFTEVVDAQSPRSIAEMGCGAGFLLAYLKEKLPSLVATGIDAADNLTRIASNLSDADVICGDHLFAEPRCRADLVICDFGIDLMRLRASTRVHVVVEAGGQPFCLNCSDDTLSQLAQFFHAWRRWGTDEAPLAFTGRIGEVGLLRAVVLAAADAGWALDAGASKMLIVENIVGETERFPALFFKPEEAPDLDQVMKSAIDLFVS